MLLAFGTPGLALWTTSKARSDLITSQQKNEHRLKTTQELHERAKLTLSNSRDYERQKQDEAIIIDARSIQEIDTSLTTLFNSLQLQFPLVPVVEKNETMDDLLSRFACFDLTGAQECAICCVKNVLSVLPCCDKQQMCQSCISILKKNGSNCAFSSGKLVV